MLTLEQLKEVRELCRNRAENGSFLTLAALAACFSLGVLPCVLPTLKYDDKYYDVLNYAFSAQNLTKATPTEGCDPCAWMIGGTFLNHTLLAYTQAVLALSQDFRKFARKSNAGADQEDFRKWQFCSNFGGVLVILGHIFFVDFHFGGSGILTTGN